MIIFNKTSRRFFLGFVAIVVGSIAIAFIAVYFSPESRYERSMASLQKQYANDIYGGDTPEETLKLFIQALEDGDVELASKYFVVEKQEEIMSELETGKKNNVLGLLIDDLKKENKSITLSETRHRFRTFNDKGIAEFSFDLILNQKTDKWKISEL